MNNVSAELSTQSEHDQRPRIQFVGLPVASLNIKIMGLIQNFAILKTWCTGRRSLARVLTQCAQFDCRERLCFMVGTSNSGRKFAVDSRFKVRKERCNPVPHLSVLRLWKIPRFEFFECYLAACLFSRLVVLLLTCVLASYLVV